MKDFLEQGFEPVTRDPNELARQVSRTELRKRFYKDVDIAEDAGGFQLLVDDRGVRTPAKRALVAPKRIIADAIAAEWDAQKGTIDPASMPMTRLSNSIIDGVSDRLDEVREDVAAYFGTDLLFYRADGPDGLTARQTEHWDPVVRWAADELGARFVLAEGIVHVKQSAQALEAARQALPSDIWTVGALHSVTTLTGSALLALALFHGFLDAPAVWKAAHVDEDWNFEKWGADDGVMHRRRSRETELGAAALVMRAMRE